VRHEEKRKKNYGKRLAAVSERVRSQSGPALNMDHMVLPNLQVSLAYNDRRYCEERDEQEYESMSKNG
jgi:hypothetical protein